MRLFAILFAALTASAAAQLHLPIHDAALRQNLGDLQRLLKKNPGHVNAIDTIGRTPLRVAIESIGYKRDTVVFLLRAGADPNLGQDYSATVLHSAVIKEDPELIKLLLAAGAKREAKDMHGRTAFDIALSSERNSVALLLKPSGLVLTIHQAAQIGDTRAVRELIESDPQLMRVRNKDGFLPIQIAARAFQKEVVEYLRSRWQGDVPIHVAAATGDAGTLLRILNERPQMLDSKDNQQQTALDWAVRCKQLEMASLLLAQGASLGQASWKLQDAIRNDDLEMVKLLLQYGAKKVDGRFNAHQSALALRRKQIADFLR